MQSVSHPTPSPSSSSQVRIEPTARSTQLVGYVCLWDECGERFDSLTDLTTHLMLNADTTHLVREGECVVGAHITVVLAFKTVAILSLFVAVYCIGAQNESH